MKSLFIFIGVISVLMVSCKKDQQHPVISHNTPVKKYLVKFKGGTFSQYSAGIGVKNPKSLLSTTRTNAISDTISLTADGINKYYFIAYDAAGNEVERISKTLSQGITLQNRYIHHVAGTPVDAGFYSTVSPPFDTITDSLATGTYTIIIVAASINLSSGRYVPGHYEPGYNDFYINTQQEESLHGGVYYNPLSSANFQYDWGLDAIPNSADTYYYRGTLTVGTQDIEQTFVLNRIVGEMEVNIEDVGLGDGGAFYVTLDNEYMGLNLNDFSPVYQAEALGIGSPIDSIRSSPTNTTFYHYIINTTSPINVTITYVDANNKGVNKTISGVQFARNVKTILTGKILDTAQTNSVKKTKVSVSPALRIIHF
jgi:hypothetical protein